MTRLALANYAAAALFVAPILAHATGLTGGTSDPLVVPPGDVRLLGLGTGATGGILTPVPPTPDGCSFWSGCDVLPDAPTPVPVPPMLPVFAIALAALIWKGWK